MAILNEGVCRCIKYCEINSCYDVDEKYHYCIDGYGRVFLWKYPLYIYPNDMFYTLKDFHEYFKEC